MTTPLDHPPASKRLIAYVVPAKTETDLDPSDLLNYLRSHLPDYMLPSAFIQLETLPRTANGKIDLQTLSDLETNQSSLETSLVPPRDPREQILANIWAEVLGLGAVGIHDNFFEVGGDSILSIQIVSKAREAGLSLMPNQLFEHQTIAELAAVVSQQSVVQIKQDLVTGSVPLTPIQHWFFAQHLPEPHHWNQSMLWEIPAECEVDWLQQAIQHLWLHHDALRLQFQPTPSEWQQVNVEGEVTIPLEAIDLSHLPADQQGAAIEQQGTRLHASFNLSEGALMRVAFFNLGAGRPGRLLMILHHLVVDTISWEILRQDLATLYDQLRHNQTLQLPPKTTSFQDWAQALVRYATSDALGQEAHYWLNQLAVEAVKLPRDQRIHSQALIQRKLTILGVADTQALLQHLPATYNIRIHEVLLTALAQVLALRVAPPAHHTIGEKLAALMIDLEGHGREAIATDIDISRTVGWFTSIFPVALRLEDLAIPDSALKSVKEQLRQIPNRGMGYGLLRYLRRDRNLKEKLETLPQAEILFNYLGQSPQPTSPSAEFSRTSEQSGLSHSPQNPRSYLLEINAWIAQKQLHFDWIYHPQVQSAVETIVPDVMSALRTLIEHGTSSEVIGFTPSDFPEVDLNQAELDDFIRRLT